MHPSNAVLSQFIPPFQLRIFHFQIRLGKKVSTFLLGGLFRFSPLVVSVFSSAVDAIKLPFVWRRSEDGRTEAPRWATASSDSLNRSKFRISRMLDEKVALLFKLRSKLLPSAVVRQSGLFDYKCWHFWTAEDQKCLPKLMSRAQNSMLKVMTDNWQQKLFSLKRSNDWWQQFSPGFGVSWSDSEKHFFGVFCFQFLWVFRQDIKLFPFHITRRVTKTLGCFRKSRLRSSKVEASVSCVHFKIHTWKEIMNVI